MIDLNKIYFSLEDRVILEDISLNIPKGKVSVILGPSGAGKSSILKIILGLWKPQKGYVTIDGVNISNLTEQEMLPLRRKMGMVFQGNALFDSLTVKENTAYFLREQNKLSEKEISERVSDTLSFVNLSGTENLHPDQLSGGMKKRVAIARAIAFKPDIVFFDEPTTGLDPINSRSILTLIEKIKQTGSTVVVVTHILDDATSIGDKLTLINNGKLIETGSVSEMLNSQNNFVKDFFQKVYHNAELLKNY